MDIMHFLTETDFGRCVFTTLVSMIPIIELRGGIPFGVALGLPYQEAFVSAVIGNIIPAPFIIVYIRKIFMMMRRYMPRLNGVVDKMEKKAHLKGQKVSKYKYIGLTLDNLDWVVCHQANSRIIDHCVKALHADGAKFYKNMDRHGNTSAASIPVALNELAESGQLHPGQTLACIGFGGGLTWGGMIVEYKG